ncbi:diaminohydroxyphosphoribosylaminopyrimidine deaminase / 5-amino-6-(5-phosphoribosylamino)uracil reductase [Alkalispirochaeta americana]|uniref:Riboflavin biosynthesis protein RibD n=1 Tax=Alkalispirochaeta americana TaxID=159291 RepID=A0A1N6TI48_9SPIO|nr:bifunctional diaminohydroxyphosphoribosylaminopyrimidine deaminase/5-amino-6-(5-phosphoribosylamino)uracil reductase RibD [Alkalispirochaeta americana]SIQ52917.1 diaminohydroxyphosphoribosylaminopyrimidine deaminase / 5-amino-6-(5-phosphoribosylamino)uracil reductase [Alkalispirochaeta americana]
MLDDQDDRRLVQTLELAQGGAGRVEPNPQVGAVIVQAGEVIATGFHRRYGEAHAEAEALARAGSSARGGVLYCNLEPCSHRGPGKHQPPCVDAIIAAGISRVVVGQQDPNPAVRGRGLRRLREAGIIVDCADDPAPFIRHNRAFNTTMALGRPFVHLKCAISLDGRLATARGDSRWITDEKARAGVHRLRGACDAVLVGRNTAETDDPLLTVRDAPLPARGQPRAIVLDSQARLSRESSLVRHRAGELLLCVSEGAPRDDVLALQEKGVTVLPCREDPRQGLDLKDVLRSLKDQGVRSILVEGGGLVITAFLRAGLFDRLTAYVAPLVLGAGREAVGDLGIHRIDQAVAFEEVRWDRIGNQQCFDGYRRGWAGEIVAVAQEGVV